MESVVFSCFRCWECLEVWCPCSCIRFGTNLLALYTIFLTVLLLFLYVPEFSEFPNSFLHFFSLRRSNPLVSDINYLAELKEIASAEEQPEVVEVSTVSALTTKLTDDIVTTQKTRNLRKIFRFPQSVDSRGFKPLKDR